jgi:hypothetical protein
MLNKKLQNKILRMANIDQKLRKKGVKNTQDKKTARYIYNIDTKNTKEAKKIIKKYGWPTFDLIGKKASNALWLLVQHADRDIKFQKKCLKLLKKTIRNKQAHPKNLAYLTDRVLVIEGKKQKFGTQYMLKKNKFILKPVTDKKNLNKRRMLFGLTTIKEQDKKMKKDYSPILKLKKIV